MYLPTWLRASRRRLLGPLPAAERKRKAVRPRLEALEDRLTPAVLTVGPGQMYALPSQAAAAAHDGDTIDISSNGNYNGDTCLWTQNNLTIQGVGSSRAHIDITGKTAYGDKGIWVLDGSNTTINNIELSGAHDTLNTGHNWAGIRLEGNTLTLNNDYFHNNDDGILIDKTNISLGPTSNIAIYGCEFANNGYGDGQSHNMYINVVTSFTLENCYSHDANEGHLVKSRALTNYILYNRLEDGPASTSTASYELDLPQGGTSYVIGNLIEQGPYSANHTIISYAEEGALNPGESLYLVNNTVVNDYGGGGTFVNVPTSGTSALLENNIFCGPGTVAAGTGSVTQITNLVSNSPGFVNRAGYDYHLTAGSPAIDAGTDPGTVNGFNLTPIYEYLDPLSLQSRPVDGHPIDIGAYEYATSASPTQTATGDASTIFSTNAQSVTLTADVTSSAGTVNEGTVTFTVMQGGTVIGRATTSGEVSNGDASVSYSLPAGLAAATYSIDAVYNPGPDFQGSSDNTHTLTVTPANAITTAANATAYYSPNKQSVTLNATLADGSFPKDTVDEGTVTFTVLNGKTPIGTATGSVSAGAASAAFNLPAGLAPGSYSIDVSYSDSAGNFTDNGDTGGTLTLNPAKVTASASSATVVYSTNTQSVTLNATVADSSFPGDTVDEGTVTFTIENGGTTLGTAQGTVSGGAASAAFNLPAGQAAGIYTVAVHYNDPSGNFSDRGDTSADLIIGVATATTVARNGSAAFRSGSQDVTLTADVTSSAGTVNEGTVTFTVMQGSNIIGTATTSNTVSNGQASVSYTLPVGTAAGSYTIAVAYSDQGGNFSDGGDTSAALTLAPANVTTTAGFTATVYSPNAQTVTLRADVADSTNPSDTVAEGTVTFTVANDATTLGTVQGTVSNGTASADFALPAGFATGSYSIAAAYSDKSGNYSDSGDKSATLSVVPASVLTTAFTTSAVYSSSPQTVTLDAAVADGSISGDTINEGIVTFTIANGSTVVGSVQGNVHDGTASASIGLPAGLAAGSYTITAHYSDSAGRFYEGVGNGGNAAFTIAAAATSAQLVQVSLAPNFLALTVTETLTAHVSSSTPVEQGTVTFYASGHAIAANVDGNGNAVAAVTVPMLSLLGPQDIRAGYNDAANNLTPSADQQTAAWRIFNPLLPSTATFAPSGESVTADLFGLFITYTNDVLTEIDFGSIHLVFSYSAVGQLKQVSFDGRNLL